MSTQLHAVLVIYCLLAVVSSAAAILWLLWLGLERAGLPRPTRVRTWGFVTLVVTAWYCGFSFLAAHSFFQASRTVNVPALPFGVFLPIVLGLWYALRSPAIRKTVEAIPLSWLVAVQFYRVIGVIFAILAAMGQLPHVFGYPTGYGDVAVGLLALPTAWMLAKGTAYSRTAAYVWNGLGILDFVVALTTGFLSSPGQLQQLALDHPNILATGYPLVMISTLLVPLSWILHMLSLWKLQKQPAPAVRHLDSSPGTVTHLTFHGQ